MPGPLRCNWELSFHLQQSAFRKMERIYFAIFPLSLTGEILSHERHESWPLHHFIQKAITVITKGLNIDGCKPLSVNFVSMVLIRLTYWYVCTI